MLEEHSYMLEEHSYKLEEHSYKLEEHGYITQVTIKDFYLWETKALAKCCVCNLNIRCVPCPWPLQAKRIFQLGPSLSSKAQMPGFDQK